MLSEFELFQRLRVWCIWLPVCDDMSIYHASSEAASLATSQLASRIQTGCVGVQSTAQRSKTLEQSACTSVTAGSMPWAISTGN